jgi:L-threonylcarbamoyladenylate synthase
VKTRIIRINPDKAETRQIQLIHGILSRGGVIVYPTDTYYGLGANGFQEEAVKKIFELKTRESTRPLPVLVADVNMALEMAAEIPAIFHRLSAEFWPGPLTLVLKAAAFLSPSLVGTGKTIGVRLPAVSWIQKLIRQAGFPLVATSANISGQAEIAAVEKVIEVFDHKVDLILDGGKAPGLRPSTVLDLTSGKAVLVREGAIPKLRLSRYLT